MTSTTAELKAEKIELRTTRAEKMMIEQAAQAEGLNVTSFIFSRVMPEVTRILGERSVFVLNPSQWEKFNAVLDRPAAPKPALRKLASRSSVLEDRRKLSGRAGKS